MNTSERLDGVALLTPTEDQDPHPSGSQPAGHATAAANAPRPGQPSTRLRAMPPALLASVHVMRENTERRLLSAVLPTLGGVGASIVVVGLLKQTWWALSGLAVVVLVVALLVVAIARVRDALGNDLRTGQIKEIIGPAEIERHSGRSTSHYLCLHDRQRLNIDGKLYARLQPLAEKETDPGLWTKLMRSETVHRIPWLTVVLLSESSYIVEVRDAVDQVVHRNPDLRGIDLDG